MRAEACHTETHAARLYGPHLILPGKHAGILFPGEVVASGWIRVGGILFALIGMQVRCKGQRGDPVWQGHVNCATKLDGPCDTLMHISPTEGYLQHCQTHSPDT